MFGRGFELFKIFGISIKADWSWLIIAVLITWSLASGLFPHYYPGLSSGTYAAMGVLGALGLFLSIVVHELAHALVARRHRVPMRGITLFVFGGVAEMQDEPKSAMSEFWIALAGPAMSIVVGATFWTASLLLRGLSVTPAIVGVLAYLGVINLVLVAFNLVPAFPLDGGRVLRAVLWRFSGNFVKSTQIASTIGSAFGAVLILLGVFAFVSGNFIGGMWWLLLGWFLIGAAQASYRHALMQHALTGQSVRRFMQHEVHTVPPTVTLEAFVDDYVYRHHHKMFPVADNGRLLGCLTTRRLREVPRPEWSQHTVGEIAEACSDENTIEADAGAEHALRKMTREGTSRLVVVDHGHLEGVVSLRDMLNFISLRLEVEQPA